MQKIQYDFTFERALPLLNINKNLNKVESLQ